jgi:hypothetical protein
MRTGEPGMICLAAIILLKSRSFVKMEAAVSVNGGAMTA